MSYYLMVFDQSEAPRRRDEFMEWFNSITEWGEERDYDSPDNMSGNLPVFYDVLRHTFPPMNGPNAPDIEAVEDESYLTDYCCASNAIYLGFAWSVAVFARESVIAAAQNADVGFFDVSSDGGVILYSEQELTEYGSNTT